MNMWGFKKYMLLKKIMLGGKICDSPPPLPLFWRGFDPPVSRVGFCPRPWPSLARAVPGPGRPWPWPSPRPGRVVPQGLVVLVRHWLAVLYQIVVRIRPKCIFILYFFLLIRFLVKLKTSFLFLEPSFFSTTSYLFRYFLPTFEGEYATQCISLRRTVQSYICYADVNQLRITNWS